MHIYLRSWEWDFSERLLHIWIELLHECVDVWHLLRVVHSRCRSGLMQLLHTVDPSRDFLRLLISTFDGLDVHGWSRSLVHVSLLDILELDQFVVVAVQARLIKHSDTKVFLSAVRFRHFKEGVHLSHTRDVFRNERLQLSVKINLLRLVAENVLKEVLDVRAHLKVSVLLRVIGPWHCFLIIVFVVILILLSLLLQSVRLLVVLVLQWLLLLWQALHSLILIRVDLLTVINFHCKIEVLILNIMSLDIPLLAGRWSLLLHLLLRPLLNLSLLCLRLRHFILILFFIVDLFLTVKIFT